VSNEAQIDLDKLLDQALRGVRRASIFMGLGVNAALDANFKNYRLSSLTNIQTTPDDVSDETLRHFKEEFRLWIEAGGFRELTETFAAYLDSVHKVCLAFRTARRRELESSIRKEHARFRSDGLAKKLSTLTQSFSVSPNHCDYLVSLNRARNCLTHRRGIVGTEDTQGQAEFTVFWRGLDVFGDTPDGERRNLNEIHEGGLEFPEGASVKAQLVERKRSFTQGEKLVFSTNDLAEICMYYGNEARHVLDSVIRFAESMGVQILTKIA
jgi:hypothetical protein